VHAFKVPSTLEASHDFLWRAHQHAPARGEVVVFNRSHYEDVLVARVHGLVPKDVWSKRYDRINDFEKNICQGGTHILKFFLHISDEEQLRRFKQRLVDPKRQWKISEADYTERKLWPQYVKAYEEALSKTSTANAPWFVIPADRKWFRNLAIGSILVETLESLRMKTPAPTVDIDDIRRRYHVAQRDQKNGVSGQSNRTIRSAVETQHREDDHTGD
jgi:PPK2 family polyphosphate:nucleotide phosphotransferase